MLLYIIDEIDTIDLSVELKVKHMNIKISEAARQKIAQSAQSFKTEPVARIYVEKAACSGARFGIAFDSQREGDILTKLGEISILTDTKYIPVYSNGIDIDYTEYPKEGFIIKSIEPVKTDCSGCGGCGGNSCSGCSDK